MNQRKTQNLTPNIENLRLIILLALALTWVLSLRPVRLIIGDYYYKQEKYAQAANWYDKVVRKERLSIKQYTTNHVQYEEDLSKLKSSLILAMEASLLKLSQILGFGESRNLKSLLTNQKFFLNDINHLPGDVEKEKLQKAKDKLLDFDNFSKSFEKILGNKPESRELDYLAPIGDFFKGVVDETENNFSLADSIYEKAAASYPKIASSLNERRKKILIDIANEYFYSSPLNWVKARDLYESQVRDGKATVHLFLNLAYIYAKCNNFGESYNHFRKAYELLKEGDLKNTIDHFRTKRTFVYPDDIKLIPQKLTRKYSLLKEISFFETKNLFDIIGIKVTARSDGFIGKTGVKSPIDIIIRSAGSPVGNHGLILINGKNVSPNRRGYNIVVLNSRTGEFEKSEVFDTHYSKDDVKKLMYFIDTVEKGKIICAAVCGDGSSALSKEQGEVFQKIGAKGNLYGKFHWGHGIIGVKGSRYGDAIEGISEKPLEIYVMNQNL